MSAHNVWNVTEPGSVEVAGPITRLSVGLSDGRVDVIAGDGPGARVEIHQVSGRPLQITADGTELTVGYRHSLVSGVRGARSRDLVDLQITVPADVALTLGVVKADGYVAGLRGDAKVSTVSGPVVVDQCSGSLTVTTVSGEMVVRDHTGPVEASSVSGALTVSGEIPQIAASTVSGDLTADLTTTPRSAKISGVSGAIVLRAPDVRSVSLKLNAAIGRVMVDGSEHVDVRHKGIVLDGHGSDSGSAVINTVSGDITVLAREEAPAGSSEAPNPARVASGRSTGGDA